MNAARISAERKAGQLLKDIERSKAGRPVENNSVSGSPNSLDAQKDKVGDSPYLEDGQPKKNSLHDANSSSENFGSG